MSGERSHTTSSQSSSPAAASDPIGANAQATCSRTNGSSSDNAAVSAGNAEGSRALPSTTAELRLSPLSFACFIGEPLNVEENSDCDIASSSGENLMFHGHTAWQMCRNNHFAIPLATGARLEQVDGVRAFAHPCRPAPRAY